MRVKRSRTGYCVGLGRRHMEAAEEADGPGSSGCTALDRRFFNVPRFGWSLMAPWR